MPFILRIDLIDELDQEESTGQRKESHSNEPNNKLIIIIITIVFEGLGSWFTRGVVLHELCLLVNYLSGGC